jgi:hypothetical protein
MRKINIKSKLKLVLIEWEDSVLGYQGWKFIDDNINQTTIFLSVGFIAFEDEKKVVLYPHIKNKKRKGLSGSGDITIPVSAIIKRKYL